MCQLVSIDLGQVHNYYYRIAFEARDGSLVPGNENIRLNICSERIGYELKYKPITRWLVFYRAYDFLYFRMHFIFKLQAVTQTTKLFGRIGVVEGFSLCTKSRSKIGHLWINCCSTYMACICLLYACDVIFKMYGRNLHISIKRKSREGTELKCFIFTLAKLIISNLDAP